MDQESVEFLWKASRSIPVTSKAADIIAGNLMARCQKLSSSNSIALPSETVKDSVQCKYCCSTWKDRPYRVAVKPQKKRASTRLLKKVAKQEEMSVNNIQISKGSKLKNLARYQPLTNYLMLSCPVCHKMTSMVLKKRKPAPPPPVSSIDPHPSTPESIKSKKKKKRKKDRTCGLNIPIKGLEVPQRVPQKEEAAKSFVNTGSPKNKIVTSCKNQTKKVVSKPVLHPRSKGPSKALNKNTLKNIFGQTSSKGGLSEFLRSFP